MGTWILAIDFGTTYTTAAVRRGGERPEVIEVDGDRRVPSIVVADEESGELVVGRAAADLAAAQPDRAVREPKRRIGEPSPVLLGGRPYQVTTVVAALLRYVADHAVAHMGSPPATVVLTHPATWRRTKRDAYLRAAAEAGHDGPLLVPEPVAAAIAYQQERGNGAGPGAVYDLGGGTFDAAVIRQDADGVRIVGDPAGAERIGGELFDELVAHYLGQQLPREVWEGLQSADAVNWSRAWAGFRAEARRAKEALSLRERAEVVVGHPRGQEHLTLTRAELNSIVRDHLQETVDILASTVEDSGVAHDELEAVYLVGGTSCIPLVSELVQEAFPHGRLLRRGDPKMVVATGAALSAPEVELPRSDPEPERKRDPDRTVPAVPPVKPPREPERKDPGRDRGRGGNRLRATVAMLVLAVLGVAGLLIWLWLHPQVPNQTNRLREPAEAALIMRQFSVRFDEQFHEATEKGRVIAQAPAPGSRLRKGRTVTLTVSKGPPTPTVPPLNNLTEHQASERLAAVGLSVGNKSRSHDLVVPKDQIKAWSPRDQDVPRGTPIDLTISDGPPPPPPQLLCSERTTRELARGPLVKGAYSTKIFQPQLARICTEDDLWEVKFESSDHLQLVRNDNRYKVDVMRIQRVYQPSSGGFATVNDALGGVQSAPPSLSEWLRTHPALRSSEITDSALVPGKQVDAAPIPYPYGGCAPAPPCVILFQLDPFPPEQPETNAYLVRPGERVRFHVTDVQPGPVKVLIAVTAPEADFDRFTRSLGSLLSNPEFRDARRVTSIKAELSPPSGRRQSHTLSAVVEGSCGPTGTVTFYNAPAARDENRLGETVPLNNGTASIPVTLPTPGRYMLVAAYHGDRNTCEGAVSPPVVQEIK